MSCQYWVENIGCQYSGESKLYWVKKKSKRKKSLEANFAYKTKRKNFLWIFSAKTRRQILPKKVKENIFGGIVNAKTRRHISVGNDTRLL